MAVCKDRPAQSFRFPTNQDFHKFFVGFAAGWRFTGDK
jgi:hypothetical protein